MGISWGMSNSQTLHNELFTLVKKKERIGIYESQVCKKPMLEKLVTMQSMSLSKHKTKVRDLQVHGNSKVAESLFLPEFHWHPVPATRAYEGLPNLPSDTFSSP